MFVNYTNNSRLDAMRFAPFGRVIQGMDVIDILHADYGDGAPRGRGPEQGRIESQGNQYLREAFPLLDYIKSASLVD
jgi:peptidyl-prolyl cis-trans isomerase A (cyclophilin A)